MRTTLQCIEDRQAFPHVLVSTKTLKTNRSDHYLTATITLTAHNTILNASIDPLSSQTKGSYEFYESNEFVENTTFVILVLSRQTRIRHSETPSTPPFQTRSNSSTFGTLTTAFQVELSNPGRTAPTKPLSGPLITPHTNLRPKSNKAFTSLERVCFMLATSLTLAGSGTRSVIHTPHTLQQISILD